MKKPDYPPTRTFEFGSAADRLADAEDPEEAGLLESPREDLDVLERGARWLAETYGEDAEITIKAIDTGTRSFIEGHIESGRVGDINSQLIDDHAIAAAIVEAPWLEDGDGLEEKVEAYSYLPTETSSWIGSELDDLTKLTPGN